MRKNLFLGLAFALSLLFVNSCSREDAGVQETILTESELVSELSQDQDFIEYGNVLFSLFANMPNRDGFLTNFNQSDVEKGKEVDYFTKLTGYSNEEVSSAVNRMDDLLETLHNRYPQLKYNGGNQEFIERVVAKADFIVAQDRGLTGKSGCQACVDKWKPRMIAATLFGAAGGGLIGAVAAFASTGWGAVDCLEAAGC